MERFLKFVAGAGCALWFIIFAIIFLVMAAAVCL